MHTIKLEHYSTKAGVDWAEQKAIRTENPRYNVTHNRPVEASPRPRVHALLMEDLRALLNELGRDWIWTGELLEALRSRHPERYSSWDARALAQGLREWRIPLRQINRVGPDGVRRNLKGVDLT